ncbi:DUF6252 family protein [Flavobacterium sp.]|uniref:DUF6252 family protein n=1 Tax=Flavobacterium sp. TaxID=239 RepID=UPI00260BF3CC|nr:DUF6252 family protein [Flavobacterium sp.]
MKSVSKFFFLVMLFGLFSCSNDDNGSGASSGFYLKAKVEGQNYRSFVSPTAVSVAGMLMIQSSASSGNSIQIQIANYNGVGTYTSGNNDLTAGYINYLLLGDTPTSFQTFTSVRGTGTVEITEVTETSISGTFSATAPENVPGATNQVSITEGSFRAELQ